MKWYSDFFGDLYFFESEWGMATINYIGTEKSFIINELDKIS